MQQLFWSGALLQVQCFDRAADLLRCFCDGGVQLLASLPLLRRLQSDVGALLTLLLWCRKRYRMRQIVAAVTALARRAGVQFALAATQSATTQFAGRPSRRVHPLRGTHANPWGTYTARCAAHSSVRQYEQQRYAVVRQPSLLQLTIARL